MNEASMVLFTTFMNGGSIIDLQSGSPASVEFDFPKIWDFCKQIAQSKAVKDSLKPNNFTMFLHFIHTHPKGYETYSETDVNCMRGLAMAFGQDDFTFSIVIPEDYNDLLSLKCFMSSYRYSLEQQKVIKLDKLEYITLEQLTILKLLTRPSTEQVIEGLRTKFKATGVIKQPLGMAVEPMGRDDNGVYYINPNEEQKGNP